MQPDNTSMALVVPILAPLGVELTYVFVTSSRYGCFGSSFKTRVEYLAIDLPYEFHLLVVFPFSTLFSFTDDPELPCASAWNATTEVLYFLMFG
ncbi:hypothetical protein ST47_g4720 [Ascochyta rabiei]|uniref:Uncharacterized protein n=1 Tax=Didymella rabiei TaxID=5454 RepID=A0A163F660_DIDRA|nr:hypothetical protein ST47_g4720 [Ascochyta rabiei]